MSQQLSYQFYIRDLEKFESNVIVLLEKYGYRVSKVNLHNILLSKGHFLSNLFQSNELARRSDIHIDYADNMVKLIVDFPGKTADSLTVAQQQIWNSFVSNIINCMQVERNAVSELANPHKKSKVSFA